MQTIELLIYCKPDRYSAVELNKQRVMLSSNADSGFWAVNKYFHNYLSAN